MTETTEFPTKNLFAKMADIKASLNRLTKEGKVQGYASYEYATKDDVYDVIRKQLGEHNICLFASAIGYEQEGVKSAKGAEGFHTMLRMEITLACGDTGQIFTCQWVGEATDYGDKSTNKASSLGMKYFLLNTFLLSTGDIAEDESQGSVEHSQTERKAQPKQQPKPPAPPSRASTPPVREEAAPPVDNGGQAKKVHYAPEPTLAVETFPDGKTTYMVISGARLYSRKALKALGYDGKVYDDLGKPGDHVLPDAVMITYTISNDGRYNLIESILRVSSGEWVNKAGEPIAAQDLVA